MKTLPGGMFFLLLAVVLNAGCRSKSPKSTVPITEVQAPAAKSVPPQSVDSRERRLQQQIDSMQEQVGALSTRAEALGRFYSSQMQPKWTEKVQAARAEASMESERLRYLEATRALLARRLEALRAEIKVYEEFVASDPSIARP